MYGQTPPKQKNTSIDDMKDVILEVQAEMMEIVREVMQDAIAPQIKQAALGKWASMSADEKERFKTERPQDYAALFSKG